MVSKKPRKQRKALYQAPLHKRQKLVAASLSKDLRKQFKRRSLPVRKGDEVKVMRGEFKGKTGKVVKVDLKHLKVYIDGITRKKSTGEEVRVPIHPSNLMIIKADLSDKMRQKIIERTMKIKGG
jgi:large subunit ribosomal protein L24